MKKIIILLALCAVFWGIKAQTSNNVQQIILQLSTTVGWDAEGHSIHKIPPFIPTIFYESTVSTLYFEDPCYESTLKLIIPGTETVVYTYDIPDGTDTVQLPSTLSGEYELHIHRGNYCFYGLIVLP